MSWRSNWTQKCTHDERIITLNHMMVHKTSRCHCSSAFFCAAFWCIRAWISSQITSWQMIITRIFFGRCRHKFSLNSSACFSCWDWTASVAIFAHYNAPWKKKQLNCDGDFSADMNAFSSLCNVNNDAHLFNSNFLCASQTAKKGLNRRCQSTLELYSRSNAFKSVKAARAH